MYIYMHIYLSSEYGGFSARLPAIVQRRRESLFAASPSPGDNAEA